VLGILLYTRPCGAAACGGVFDKDRNTLYTYSTLRSGYLSGLVSIFLWFGST